MHIYLSLSIHLYICKRMYLSVLIYLSIYLCSYLSLYITICPSIYLPIHLSIGLHVCMCHLYLPLMYRYGLCAGGEWRPHGYGRGIT